MILSVRYGCRFLLPDIKMIIEIKEQYMKKKRTFIGILVIIIAVALDQLTKQWAVAALKGKESLVLIKGVLEFSYLENTGAAFGSFRGLQIPLILVTLVIIAFVIFKLITLPDSPRFQPIRICGLFLISGAAGSLIDRVMNRYVADFIYFVPIDFPKFNVADCYVTVTVFVLIFLFLFYYKSEETDIIISLKAKQNRHS